MARGDNTELVPSLVRWLTGARTRGRWGNTQENATALLAFTSYYKKFEATPPNMTATVQLGGYSTVTVSRHERDFLNFTRQGFIWWSWLSRKPSVEPCTADSNGLAGVGCIDGLPVFHDVV